LRELTASLVKTLGRGADKGLFALLVLVSVLAGASLGSWIGGISGGFVAALLSIPVAGAGQVIMRELWPSTAPAASGGPQRG
jgi:hypothetical protein